MPMIEFFGRPENASINFMLNEMTRSWECNGKVWTSQSSKNRMNISGFYEGSIIFGNRFKDTNISTINKLDNLTKNDLEPAREFVYKNLGQILKNDEEFYKELFLVKKNSAKNIGLTREAFCIKKAGNQFISQPRMSTGENLLLSILQSLEYVRKRRKKTMNILELFF